MVEPKERPEVITNTVSLSAIKVVTNDVAEVLMAKAIMDEVLVIATEVLAQWSWLESRGAAEGFMAEAFDLALTDKILGSTMISGKTNQILYNQGS